MTISPFFRNLHTAYRAELDDLVSDSDGRDVLRQRLAAKRQEIGFLVQMMELSPEMVAVVFHQAFQFKHPAEMEHLLTLEADELPEWRSVADGIELASWARTLVKTILQAPAGEWFMTLAAAMHYMLGKPIGTLNMRGSDATDENDDDNSAEDDLDDLDDFNDHESDEVRGNARDHEEAGANWLEEQGFDRKD